MALSEWTAQYIYEHWPDVFSLFLIDRSCSRNVIWATKSYEHLGAGYFETDEITPTVLFANGTQTLLFGAEKTLAIKTARAKSSGEVFTPSWMCNIQNSLVDDAWFGRQNVFNIPQERKWKTTESIGFTDFNEFVSYVYEPRLEVACGEAPYLASRFDAVSGGEISVKDRMGFLDRKLRAVSEMTVSPEEWIIYGIASLKSVYGFELQGDNVVLARLNLFLDFFEHFLDRYPDHQFEQYMREVAEIISWNIFQMDGLKCVAPLTCHMEEAPQMSLFNNEAQPLVECPGCQAGGFSKHNGVYCLIFDWEKGKTVRFVDMIRKGNINGLF